MGKKINPTVFRLGLSEKWRSRWYAGRDFSKFLEQDIKIRRSIKKTLRDSGIDKIEIERSRGEITINISSAKPGLIIGRGGAGIEELKKKIKEQFLDADTKIKVNITEISAPNLSAAVIVEAIRSDLERRIPFRRVMKQNMDKVMKANGKGVKIMLAGRLNGVDIARSEKLTEGKIPLATIRADIDYSRGVANTIYGVIGIKVWIYKGEYFDKKAKDKKAVKTSTKTTKLFSETPLEIQSLNKVVETDKENK